MVMPLEQAPTLMQGDVKPADVMHRMLRRAQPADGLSARMRDLRLELGECRRIEVDRVPETGCVENGDSGRFAGSSQEKARPRWLAAAVACSLCGGAVSAASSLAADCWAQSMRRVLPWPDMELGWGRLQSACIAARRHAPSRRSERRLSCTRARHQSSIAF